MRDDELNKWLHENVMGECWHDWKVLRKEPNFKLSQCRKCSISDTTDSNPDYCNSLDAVAKVEAKVVGRVGAKHYTEVLAGAIQRTLGIAKINRENDDLLFRNLVTAHARQRAEACKEALAELSVPPFAPPDSDLGSASYGEGFGFQRRRK